MQLRPYAPADLAELYAIDQACYEPGIAYSRAELRWYLAQRGAKCIIAESGGEIAGFILTADSGPRAYIVTIDVPEPWRRRGVGTALLAEIEAQLAAGGVRLVELETATTNEAAVAFWQRHGYRTVGMRKGYYLGRLDAYSMRKSLPVAKEN
jgi:ribosomal-protein-alanine N-acetyltransferase